MCHDGMTKATAAATVECFLLPIANDVLIASEKAVGQVDMNIKSLNAAQPELS